MEPLPDFGEGKGVGDKLELVAISQEFANNQGLDPGLDEWYERDVEER